MKNDYQKKFSQAKAYNNTMMLPKKKKQRHQTT